MKNSWSQKLWLLTICSFTWWTGIYWRPTLCLVQIYHYISHRMSQDSDGLRVENMSMKLNYKNLYEISVNSGNTRSKKSMIQSWWYIRNWFIFNFCTVKIEHFQLDVLFRAFSFSLILVKMTNCREPKKTELMRTGLVQMVIYWTLLNSPRRSLRWFPSCKPSYIPLILLALVQGLPRFFPFPVHLERGLASIFVVWWPQTYSLNKHEKLDIKGKDGSRVGGL